MTRFRNYIRYLHREFDGIIGTLFSKQKPLKYINHQGLLNLNDTSRSLISYSRKDLESWIVRLVRFEVTYA